MAERKYNNLPDKVRAEATAYGAPLRTTFVVDRLGQTSVQFGMGNNNNLTPSEAIDLIRRGHGIPLKRSS